jgi:hypothetical protein
MHYLWNSFDERYTYTRPSSPNSLPREPRWMRFLMAASVTPSLAAASRIVTRSVPLSCLVSKVASSPESYPSSHGIVAGLTRGRGAHQMWCR